MSRPPGPRLPARRLWPVSGSPGSEPPGAGGSSWCRRLPFSLQRSHLRRRHRNCSELSQLVTSLRRATALQLLWFSEICHPECSVLIDHRSYCNRKNRWATSACPGVLRSSHVGCHRLTPCGVVPMATPAILSARRGRREILGSWIWPSQIARSTRSAPESSRPTLVELARTANDCSLHRRTVYRGGCNVRASKGYAFWPRILPRRFNPWASIGWTRPWVSSG